LPIEADRCRRLGQVVVVVIAATALAVAVGPSTAPAEASFSGPDNDPAGVTPHAVVVAWW
jgi:hypothetical protein